MKVNIKKHDYKPLEGVVLLEIGGKGIEIKEVEDFSISFGDEVLDLSESDLDPDSDRGGEEKAD